MWDVIDRDTGEELYWTKDYHAALLFQLVNKSLNTIIIFV